jgi:hypothetical protein
VNTYRVWLRHELFCGRLSDPAFQASEANLDDYITTRCKSLISAQAYFRAN